MAKIKQGILGGFSGKVANVVGTSWKGRAVMKSQPLSVANPRTALQTEQRGKFSEIAKLASSILTTFIQPVENPISGNVSGYNKFVKDNKSAFSALGEIVAANFGCGGGKLPSIVLSYSDIDPAAKEINLEWQNAQSISPLRLTDKIYAVGFDKRGVLSFVAGTDATREDEHLTLNANDAVESISVGDTFYVLMACVSADGREVSVWTPCVTFVAES